MADDVDSESSSAVLPPFVVLAVAVGVTIVVGFALADWLRGGQLSLSDLAPIIAGDAFALFALVFVWVDTALVVRRDGRPWVGAGQSWRSSAVAALGSLVIWAALGVPITVTMGGLMQAGLIRSTLVAVPALLLLGAGLGLRANVRARRRTPVGPPPPF